MKADNQLEVILKEQDLEKTQANALLEAFGAPFNEAGVVLERHKMIKVTSAEDKQQMKEAREMRLILKKTRVEVEHARKDLKADIIKQGRAIDSVAKFVKEVIEPAEEYLQLQEDFIKIQEAEAAAQRKADRIEELSQYTEDVNQYRFETMTDDEFDQLIDRLDREKKALAEAEKAAEEKRIAAEKAEAERIEAQRIENEKLKKEAAEREDTINKVNDRRNKILATGAILVDDSMYVIEGITYLKEYELESLSDEDFKYSLSLAVEAAEIKKADAEAANKKAQ